VPELGHLRQVRRGEVPLAEVVGRSNRSTWPRRG
jgi:hypothetical protein